MELGEDVSIAVTTMVLPGTVIIDWTGVVAEADGTKISVSIAVKEWDPSGASKMPSVSVVVPRLISSIHVYGETVFVIVVYAV